MTAVSDEERRAAVRAVWARGDYATFGDLLAPVGAALCARVGVADLDVLDVGTGTGGTALAAARDGGRVSGVDITPELLAVARTRGEGEHLQVGWREGDAQSLPYADASFDRVLSTFAVIFVHDPRRAAAELVRVCRPDGTIGVCGWTADSVLGRLSSTLVGFLPAPPPAGPMPFEWGDAAAVGRFFHGLTVDLSFDHGAVELPFASVEDAVVTFEEKSGPVMGARDALEPAGRWPQARAAMAELFADANVATDATLRLPGDYLVTIAVRSGASATGGTAAGTGHHG